MALLLVLAWSFSPTAPPAFSRPQPTADALSYVPPSDGLVAVDVRRLLTEALPRVFAGDAAKLEQVDAEINRFKTRTGIDPRLFDQIVLSLRYRFPSANVTRIDTVAIAHGRFDARAVVTAGRTAAHGRYREENHHGTNISIFNLNDQSTLFGIWQLKLGELAVAALDANTLALGKLVNVRAAIEAGKDGTRANAGLMALATRDPNALIGFGANFTPALRDNLHLGSDSVAKDVASIRQVYGSIDRNQADFALLLVARTEDAASAKSLGETVTDLKPLSGIFISRMPPAKQKLAQSALDKLTVTTRDNEVQIRTQVPAAEVAAIFGHR